MLEVLKVIVPGAVIPLTVFGANWAYRHRSNYTQTAAADFILAVLVFDGSVIAVADGFQPLVRNSDLRSIIVLWHILMGCTGLAVYWLIVNYGEPPLADHYKRPRATEFPFVAFVLCWAGIFALVSAHVLFFVWKGSLDG